MLRKSSHKLFFDDNLRLEGGVHIVTQYDGTKPKSIQKALTCQIKNEWRKQ